MSEHAEGPLETVIRRIKRNPVVLGALALAAFEAIDGLSWRSAVIVGGGIVVRFFTVPAHEVGTLEDALEHVEFIFEHPPEPGDDSGWHAYL